MSGTEVMADKVQFSLPVSIKISMKSNGYKIMNKISMIYLIDFIHYFICFLAIQDQARGLDWASGQCIVGEQHRSLWISVSAG